ncbi:hypothetical protein [Gynurincola endophyticus]|uniref:hypothetical protein n=1 Tax=Gynurincola endophyticus TaxID=2479004 RepID=UPI000F8CC5EE|nr:hypothetical protein [Gynurincola endophyticus]
MNKYLYFFLIFLMSCKGDFTISESQLQLLSFVGNDKNKNDKIFDYYPDGRIYISIDTLDGEVFGNYYQFYENGLLNMYQFMVDDKHSTYLIEFDSVGKIIEQQGNPICKSHINFNYKPDSASISVLFSSFPYRKITASISGSNGEFYPVETTKHPTLSYLECYNYSVLIKDVRSIFQVIKVECLDMSGNIQQYKDTINFFKDIP